VRLHGCLASRYSKLPKTRRKAPTFAVFEKELLSMLADPKRPDSLPSTLAEVARIGGNVRERLSADMMLLIGKLRDAMQGEPNMPLLDYQAMLTACLELLSAFSGLERENIHRGWLFMSLGRRLERAMYLTRQLREITRPLATEDWSFLERLLEVADSSMSYRARYYTTLQPLAVLDVLMSDAANPRSLDFQLEHLVELYEKLPRHANDDLLAMQKTLTQLRTIDLQAIHYPSALAAPGRPASDALGLNRLDQYLQELERLLPSWSNDLSSRYFSHARTQPVAMGE
jgi:uncharacterized alpha-E superfamily protein